MPLACKSLQHSTGPSRPEGPRRGLNSGDQVENPVRPSLGSEKNQRLVDALERIQYPYNAMLEVEAY
jgi:hypothetical protein